MRQPRPCLQCGHHELAGFASSSIAITLQQSVQSPHALFAEGATVMSPALAGLPVRRQCFAERQKQFAIDGIALRIVFPMPLHAERKARCFRNPYRLDGAVFGDPFDDDPLAWFEDALAVQRIDADGLAAADARKAAIGNETDLMPVGEDAVWARADVPPPPP